MAGVSLVSELYFLNMSLKCYDQMETIPLFQASIILNNVLCGGVIFQEFAKYTFGNMCILFAGVCICMAGIAVIIMKNNILAKQQLRERVNAPQATAKAVAAL